MALRPQCSSLTYHTNCHHLGIIEYREMTSFEATSFECLILARLGEDLQSRNVVYAMIGDAAVWLLSDGQGRGIHDIDVLVDSDCDVRDLKAQLSQLTDHWYEEKDVNFFAGLSWSNVTGTSSTII
jgi:hypothetical protein